MVQHPTFEWDQQKNEINIEKHGVSFFVAQRTFLDPNRVIAKDLEHSITEKRYYCFGKVDEEIITVRFTYKEHNNTHFWCGVLEEGEENL